jgi:glc operon protein GlcG
MIGPFRGSHLRGRRSLAMNDAPRPVPAAVPSTGVPTPYGAPISLADAARVAEAARLEAEANGWPMVIAVFDSTAHLVLLHRMDQANIGAIAFAQRKAETAVRFRRSTKVYEDLLAGGGLRLLSVAADIITIEGGLPLLQGGVVVGSIGVSGMTSAQDGQVATAGAGALE